VDVAFPFLCLSVRLGGLAIAEGPVFLGDFDKKRDDHVLPSQAQTLAGVTNMAIAHFFGALCVANGVSQPGCRQNRPRAAKEPGYIEITAPAVAITIPGLDGSERSSVKPPRGAKQ
jgi:hypothetical protein